MGRKKAILATLATPVAQDAAPTKAGEPAEEGDTQDLAPKAPAKKAAKPAPPAIDQDLLQVCFPSFLNSYLNTMIMTIHRLLKKVGA